METWLNDAEISQEFTGFFSGKTQEFPEFSRENPGIARTY